MRSIIEIIARSSAKTPVAVKRNFSMFLLLLNISPPPPKTGERPPPWDWRRMAIISRTEIMICKMVRKVIERLLYCFDHCFRKLEGVMING